MEGKWHNWKNRQTLRETWNNKKHSVGVCQICHHHHHHHLSLKRPYVCSLQKLELDVYPCMKSLHIYLNIVHSQAISCHLSHNLPKSSCPTTFLQTNTQSSTPLRSKCPTTSICHASPHPPHSEHPEDYANPRCPFCPSLTLYRSITPSYVCFNINLVMTLTQIQIHCQLQLMNAVSCARMVHRAQMVV